MVSKCANPDCDRPFKYLHDGKLFIVGHPTETPNGTDKLRVLFLCKECSKDHTVLVHQGEPIIVFAGQGDGEQRAGAMPGADEKPHTNATLRELNFVSTAA